MSTATSKRVPIFPSHFPPNLVLKVVYKYTGRSGFRTLGPDFRTFRTFGTSAQDLPICPKVRKSGPRSDPTFGARNRVWPPKVGSGRQSAEIRKSWKILKIQDFAQIPTFPEKSRFLRNPGSQDRTGFRTFRTNPVYLIPDVAPMCAYCCQKQRPTAYALHVRTCNHTLTHIIRVKGKLMTCINLVRFARFWTIVRFENNFWNK